MTTAIAPALENLKQRAAERFAAVGFPTTRNEDWKFTSVAPIAQVVWQAPRVDSSHGMKIGVLEPFRLGLPVHELVFLNGRFAPDLSQVGDLPEGVVVQSMRMP